MTREEEIEEILSRLEREMGLLEVLRESKGWGLLTSIMKEQERLRRNEVFMKSYNGLDGLIERDKLISELNGISTVLKMPGLIIDEMQMERSALINERREIEESKNANNR